MIMRIIITTTATIGYINRWTMEITNNSRHYAIPLVVGRRVAQIVFFDRLGFVEIRLICIKQRSFINHLKH